MQVNLKKALLVYFVVYVLVFSMFYLHSVVFTNVVVYDSTVIVGDHIGFDLNTTALTFGMVTSGGTSSNREIIITNADLLQKVEIYGQGEIFDWIIIPESSFIIEPNTNKNISFSISVPDNVSFGEHTGKIKFKFTKLKLTSSDF